MAEERTQRRLAAILAADVVGFSRLMEADEVLTMAALKARRKEVLDPLVAKHRGRIFKTTGDGVLVEFASAVNAVQCAVDLQQGMATANGDQPEDRHIVLRVGINLGDVMVEGSDLYGEGVNLAARLESLAESGGICISGDVYRHVRNKLPLNFHDLGEQKVKNIAGPVHAYRVQSDVVGPGVAEGPPTERPARSWRTPAAAAALTVIIAAAGLAWWQPWTLNVDVADIRSMAFPLPAKPSIAILPFTNMSDDTAQQYFADGMTEDLITDLSQLSGLFVISRNSTFVYKGMTVQPRQVAEELGVRYILEGSVRRIENQIRVNAQLIDATTGGYLWADRYDDTLDNIFALQDRITNKIFAALAVQLSDGEKANLGREDTQNIEAYDAFLRGWELYRKWTPDGFRDALPFFLRAIELDPKYGRAYAAVASIYTEGYVKAWDWSHVVGVSAEAMPGLAGNYLKEALKYPTPFAHQVASKWYVILLFSEEAIAEAARGIALDPNDPLGYSAMATALIYAGKPAEAVDFINKAMRFDPHSMPNYLFTLGMAYFGMEQFEQAVTVFETAFELNPELGLIQKAYLAAAYLHLGRRDEAVSQLDNPEIREVRDLYDLYVKYEAAYYQNDQDRFRLVGALSEIGF